MSQRPLTALRRWIARCRGLEADLLINPAVWVRIPEDFRVSHTVPTSDDGEDWVNDHDFYGERESGKMLPLPARKKRA